tara:strand:+ start:302 stop:775 length:474 start_codon:yes stop_codon:yes gene_type:complete
MNIFYLDKCPKKSAQLQYNKHVVKMILESAQMLCTAHRYYGNDNVPYKTAHLNHPSSVWCRENYHQYVWLFQHMMHLGDEYTKRYNKTHKSITKCWEFLCHTPPNIPKGTFTQPPQCMPDEYKDKCSIQAYWNYYIAEKHSVASKDEKIYKTKPNIN